jgi:general secretion pathway protein D
MKSPLLFFIALVPSLIASDVDVLLSARSAQVNQVQLEQPLKPKQKIETFVPEPSNTPVVADEDIPLSFHREETRKVLLDAVDDSWKQPVISLADVPAFELEQSPQMPDLLRSITIDRLQLDGVPLQKALSIISEFSIKQGDTDQAVNLVLIEPEKNNPLVYIDLHHLHFDKALELMLLSVGYDYELHENVVLIRPGNGELSRLETTFFPMTRSTIIRLIGSGYKVDNSDDNQSNIANQESQLKGCFEKAGVPFEKVAGAGLALADGQLIVTQTSKNLNKIKGILRRYREIKQVEIEARFLEVTQGQLEEIGFDWAVGTNDSVATADSFQSQNRSLNSAFNSSSANSTLTITGLSSWIGDDGTVTIPVSSPALTNSLDLGQTSGSLAELSGVIGNLNIEVLVNALSRSTGSDLMSAPKLTVLSGKTAEIIVAQELLYPKRYSKMDAQVGKGDSSSGSAGVAVTAGTPQDFTKRNIGVEMRVTPTVEDDGSISLSLEPTVTEFEGFVEYGGNSVAIASGQTVTVPSGFYQPIFSVRKIKTEVTIWDGATVIMGGLTREQTVSVNDKVPVLGDIPLLGKLFRSEGESSQKRNLLIFVTARMISPGGTPLRSNSGDIASLQRQPH